MWFPLLGQPPEGLLPPSLAQPLFSHVRQRAQIQGGGARSDYETNNVRETKRINDNVTTTFWLKVDKLLSRNYKNRPPSPKEDIGINGFPTSRASQVGQPMSVQTVTLGIPSFSLVDHRAAIELIDMRSFCFSHLGQPWCVALCFSGEYCLGASLWFYQKKKQICRVCLKPLISTSQNLLTFQRMCKDYPLTQNDAATKRTS